MQEKLNLYPFVILIAKDLIRAVSMLSVLLSPISNH